MRMQKQIEIHDTGVQPLDDRVPDGVAAQPRAHAIREVRLSGHVGWNAEAELRAQLDPGGERIDGQRLALSLADVTFMDSAGISALLTVQQDVARHGGRLVLFDVPRRIDQLFDVIGMRSIVPIAANLSEAREVLAS